MNWSHRYASDKKCGICRNTGYTLDHSGDNEPMGLELLPCPIPDCKHSNKPIAYLSMYGEWGNPTMHPTKNNAIMSVEKLED